VLGEITAAEIDAFIKHMAAKDLSASRKNVVIKAGTKPLRWAFAKGWIATDPTRGHILFSGDNAKRNILTPTIAAAIFRNNWNNERAKIGNMLASVTGLRCGEIQALRFQDIGPDCIYVGHSWNKEDNLKPTKNNEKRTVEIQFPFLINALIKLTQQNPWGVSPESYVFWSEYKSDIPMHGTVFLDNLRKALIEIGFSTEKAQQYLFHGWRHFYTSYMIKRLEKKLLKSQTGHKTDGMLELYGDHQTEGDRETIQTVQRETFAGLLPEYSNTLEFKIAPQTAVA